MQKAFPHALASPGTGSQSTGFWRGRSSSPSYSAVDTRWRHDAAYLHLSTWSDDHFILPFDNTSGFITSMAICHPRVGSFYRPITITAAFFDETGTRIHLDQFTLNPGQQQAFELAGRWPQLAGKRGTAEFRTDLYLSAFGLRFHPTGSFTTLLPLGR